MNRWCNRVALVTGASEGIGRQLTLLLANHGMCVIGCARNKARIDELKADVKHEKGSIDAVQCDLRDEAAIVSMFATIKQKYGRLDVCVNNAGLGLTGSLLDISQEDMRAMLDVNVIALCICTREAVKLMREANIDDGHVVNINSMSGHRVIPGGTLNFYSATKFAVTALTEGMRGELRTIDSNIRVSQISPGMVETQFGPRAFDKDPDVVYEGRPCLSAEDIAKAVEYVLSAPPGCQVHDVLMRPTKQLA